MDNDIIIGGPVGIGLGLMLKKWRIEKDLSSSGWDSTSYVIAFQALNDYCDALIIRIMSLDPQFSLEIERMTRDV